MKQLINFILLTGAILYLSSCNFQKPEGKSSISISRIDSVNVDGNPSEWQKIQACRLWADPFGNYSDTTDFRAEVKIAWNNEGLFFLIEANDDNFKYDTINPWNADAVEIFLSPFRGSDAIIQAVVIPSEKINFARIGGTQKLPEVFSGEIKSITQENGNHRITEIKISFVQNTENGIINNLALQIYADDADLNKTGRNQLVLFPVGQSHMASSSMFTVELSESALSHPNSDSRLTITDDKFPSLYVFGAQKGDKIEVYRNGEKINQLKATSLADYLPDSIDLSIYNCDIENDTVFVKLNGQSLTTHELFLAPRIFKKTQERRFDREIRNFVYADRQNPPYENSTLFIGSSSIVKWKSLKTDFPELDIIHRGFGGSVSSEALFYMDKIALPYKPSQIVYYEGDNDLAMGISPEEIRDNVKAFADRISELLPETKIYILSPKPSMSRIKLIEKYKETHRLLKELAGNYKNVVYVDVSTALFDENGKIDSGLFEPDSLHINKEGYKIWTKILRKEMGLDK